MAEPRIPLRSDSEIENNEGIEDNIVLYYNTFDRNIEEPQMLKPNDDNDETLKLVPSVYIDANILPQSGIQSQKEHERSFVYEINGVIFRDTDNGMRDTDLLEFEIIKHISVLDGHVDIELEQTSHMDGIGKELNNDESLPITIQNTPYGLVINSSVLLTENGWNTIVCGDEATCIACDKSLNIREIAGHIATDNHKFILDKFRPLKEFDVNIVRMINEIYHCGICNVTFDIEDDHLENVSHGEKVLKAINKVSDIIQADDDFDCYQENKNYDCIDLDTIEDNSSITDTVENSESIDFYEDVSVNYCSDAEDDQENEQTVQQTDVFSYADIAKKPKIFTAPKFVEIKFEDYYAKVTFDSWHMVITLRTNQFYCMACKISGPIRFKSEHCMKVEHVENLMKCNIVRDYKEHVIRKADDKLLHCGHCNNLHMKHEIRDHIETKHIKRATNINISETATLTKFTDIRSARSPKQTISHVKDTTGITANKNKLAGTIIKDNNIVESKVESQNHNKPTNILVNKTQTADNTAVVINKNNDIILNPFEVHNASNNMLSFNPNVSPMASTIFIRAFDQKYCISFLAYHMIQQRRPGAYFCWLCDVWCGDRSHTMTLDHTNRIVQAPFLPQTSFHLIRVTKYGFHCTICHMFIQKDPINHTWDQMHLSLLNRSICNSLPMSNQPTNFNQNTDIQNTKETVIEETEIIKNNENKENKKTIEDNSVTDKDMVKDVVTGKKEEKDFDTEECLYVKINNKYTKITMTSYNTLVQSGNGAYFCGLCSIDVFFQDLNTHINSVLHVINMEKCNFLKKYERHLLRQLASCYHCALCNVCIVKDCIDDHISWPTHKEAEASKIAKHNRRNEIKAGVKEMGCSTQNEIVCDMKNEFEIRANIEFCIPNHPDIIKNKKIVIIKGVALKISWDAFHGFRKRKDKCYECLICQTEFRNFELPVHVENARHKEVLENNFLLEFSPALIRKASDTILHCLTCNANIKNGSDSIKDHMLSKRHIKDYATTIAYKPDIDFESNDILTLGDSHKKK